MQIKFKQVAHLYIGCEMSDGTKLYNADSEGFMLQVPDGEQTYFRGYTPDLHKNIKPLLKSPNSFTLEQFENICKVILGVEDVISEVIGNCWAVCAGADGSDENCENPEYPNNDRIINEESNDTYNVLSVEIPNPKLEKIGLSSELTISYGCSEENRFFVPIEISSVFVLELTKLKYDVFGLIKNGQAIELKPLIVAEA